MKLAVVCSFAVLLVCNSIAAEDRPEDLPDSKLPDEDTVVDCEPCPPVPCADPVINNDETCPCRHCPNCTVRGCVNYGWIGITWWPDPCTVCSCFNNEELCTKIHCQVPECFGFPVITRPGECCPECDFGIADDECGPIPKGNRSLYVALGDEKSCHAEVLSYGCDKDLVLKDRKIFKCVPKEKLKSHRFEQNCPVRRVVYKEVRECELRLATPREIPQDDIFPNNGCDFVSD